MPLTENRRDALAELPYVLVVKPNGLIYCCEYASNLSGGAIYIQDGEPALRNSFKKSGFRLLEDVVDSPEQLKGLAAYYAEARRLKGLIDPLPKRLYPKYCQRLQDEDALERKPFDFAGLEAAMDELDQDAEPKGEPKGEPKKPPKPLKTAKPDPDPNAPTN